eukprot:10101.XXX_52713_54495_1 [CDS] Oithona nana genome sequencing.
MAELGLPGGVNPLDFLHKLATQRGLPRPDFVQVGEQGLPHNKVFVWQCSFYQVVAQGSGRSKKEAKVAAARAVRDQLNFNELPPPPTFQSQMERKLKRRLNSNGDFAGNGAESAKAQKYDYSLHFQCYSGGTGGPAGTPYGYLPMGPNKNSVGGPIDPFSSDPFALASDDSYSNAEYGVSDADSSMAAFNKGFMSRLSKLDRYVIKRHTEIYPKDQQLNSILGLVGDVEQAMKQVSSEWNEGEENSVKVEGLVRVGHLAKGLLLANDKSVSIILLCISPPTKSMLQQFHLKLRSRIKECDSEYDTMLLEKEAAFAITKPASEDSMFCYVTFTSTALRGKDEVEELAGTVPDEEQEVVKTEVTELNEIVPPAAEKEEKADIQAVTVADEADSLPSEKCLLALAELRHARWFSAMASNLPSCVECIRIMRDLCRREPSWSCLTDWSIELIVERALFSAWRPLNPAASLMRVMEVLASGILYEDGSLKDPCERTDISPVSQLSLQEREDITKGAQEYLRLMHFRQIYRVLGMPMEEAEDLKEEDKEESGPQFVAEDE